MVPYASQIRAVMLLHSYKLFDKILGPGSIYRYHLTSIENPIAEIRKSNTSYLHNGISYTGKMASLYLLNLLVFAIDNPWSIS